jgi:hypothetical protein
MKIAVKKPFNLSERIDLLIATAPRSRPWYDTKKRCWRKGHVYITKRAVFALFMEYRQARAQQAMDELDAQIAREKRARETARKRKTRPKVGISAARTDRPHEPDGLSPETPFRR